MHWFVTVSRGFGTPRGTISPRRQVTEGTITPVRMEGTLPHMAIMEELKLIISHWEQ